jgi:hypothetical protein
MKYIPGKEMKISQAKRNISQGKRMKKRQQRNEIYPRQRNENIPCKGMKKH